MVTVTTMPATRVPRPRGIRSAGQLDRAAGVLLGAAVGDAPGVDTRMAACIAQAAASGADLREVHVLDAIAANVLRAGRTEKGGSLTRTAVVALPYLDDQEAMAGAARAVSDLTHPDPLTGDACVLWCSAVRRAVLDGTFGGLRDGLALIPAGRRDHWAGWIAGAPAREPDAFAPTGSAVPVLQAAWSAVSGAYVLLKGSLDGAAGGDHIDLSLAGAARADGGAGTVAATAGALLGARWGAGVLLSSGLGSRVSGWPGLGATELVRLSLSALGVS